MRLTPTFRRAIAALTASSLVGLYAFSALLYARPAFAEAPSSLPAGIVQVSTSGCRGANTAMTMDLCEGANEAANQADDKLIKPAMQVALISSLLNLATFFFDRLAAEAAIWIATGGEGETPLFHAKTAGEAWKDFGLDIAGDAIGNLSEDVLDELEIEFDICAPENPFLKLSIQLGIKQTYQPKQPKCEFKNIMKNWKSFLATTAQTALNPSQTVLKAFADGMKPGKTELSAAVGLNLKVHERVLEAKQTNLLEQVNSGGFVSVADVVTGKVQTPASVLESEFKRQIGNSSEEPTKLQMQAAIQNSDLLSNMFLHVASVFTNTLLSQVMNRIYTGFFDEQPDVDPFDQELAAVSSRDDAANRFASLITVAPTQVENYNVLAEFAACPVGPVAVRGLNNCVMDANLLTAVARAESGVPLTVQEAIDEGLLYGDWPLIPHEGDGIPKNQDPLCYTYGYCYGNLVKLRKARVVPVGWEIAASRNDPSNPATLQEIVDGFDDCGGQGGGVDDSHQWCHLIDPEWVLKYPETQCRALVNGELQISTLSPGRAGACVDAPSCISESNDGSCDGGFGYCVQEGNVWRFRGEECPDQYASCLSFENTFTGDTADLLFNTVDQAGCDANNAGCEWYRTNKYADDGGTVDDASDDAYEWLPGSEQYVTADRADDMERAGSSPTAYAYDTTGGTTVSYASYAHEDRVYFNNDVSACSQASAGCSALYVADESLVLNVLQNPSFETDEDEDGQPDGWDYSVSAGTLDASGSYSYYGSNAYATGAAGLLYQSNVQIAPGNFYTFAFSARQAASGGTDAVSGRVALTDADGDDLDLAGTSVAGDCAVADWLSGSDNSVLIEKQTPDGTGYERFTCTFTVPDGGNGAVAQVWLYSDGAYVDAVQLELGDDASGFVEGYNSSSPTTAYLLVPPDYLGCSGAADDPVECDSYARVCAARDVGCSLYTPEDGDPSVPAIASDLDACPAECVGYAAYKQEATDREDDDFPLYFIADRATSCSSQYVGCDAFTNLDVVAEGGEGAEGYTYLRACMKPEMAGSGASVQSATYFTWEGSDAAGYQLVTWTLLKSDDSAAPCAAWDVRDEDTVACAEDASVDYETDDCDEHDDIFDNPDCREFYDVDGNVHYRDVTLTVAVDESCHPYRLDGSTYPDCEGSGGFWTDAGDCRYFGLAEESTECPETQAGCREYTGGAGRNATTVYQDDFEDGSLSEYYENAGVATTVSNESLAVDGHSMRLEFSSNSAVTTAMQFLDWSDKSLEYDGTSATCADIDAASHADVGTGCEIDYGTGNACVVAEGDANCGTLDGLLVPGKTYVLSFWAKGSDDLFVGFSDLGGTGDYHDFVDPSKPGNDALALEGAWHEYALGPLDTTDFEEFDDSAILSFGAKAGTVAYIDNVRLKSVEENIAVIKDSWIVPSTCDQTPDGADSPQYYLGCEAYADQDGNDATLYQFSDLCSEDAIGCEAVYDTQNSDDPFGATYNARCEYVTNDTTDDDTVDEGTDCVLDGETACVIAPGESYCLFDRAGALPAELPSTLLSGVGFYYMTLGPEAVAVDSDIPMYLVDDGTVDCTAENVGCEELGRPVYDQDKGAVTAFESVYYVNDPDAYGDILCVDRELFCEEWSSTQDGNFYFKDPVDQTCEYKTGVTVDGTGLYGWFRTGTSEPCDWTDTDGSETYEPGVDAAYLVGGEKVGIWRNGDAAYAGWVGECPSSYDLCTEFVDISDTSGTTYPAGTPYYFLDDESLSEEALTASEQCNGQASQKEGCAVLYDANDSELRYNATASYVASTHADDLFGDAPGSKQDPVSCGDDGTGGVIVTPDGDEVDLCRRRCYYDVENGDSIVGPSAYLIKTSNGFTYSDEGYLNGSCYDDADCPALDTVNGEDVEGTCVEAFDDLDVYTSIGSDESIYLLTDDSNRVVKVYRDRECSAWLSCQSAQISWNERTSRYETICDKVGLCTRYTRTGDTSFCTEWAETDALVLDAGEYAARNVTWNGVEYSGYAIPGQLPVEHYDQINISPETGGKICTTSLGVPEIKDGGFRACEDVYDCTESGYMTCTPFPQEFRLAYNAGPCDMGVAGWQGECTVGHCEDSGDSCSSDDDCDSSSFEQCVVGYCQDVSSVACFSDDDADGDGVADGCRAAFPVCDTLIGMCVNQLALNTEPCVSDSDCSGFGTPTCTADAESKTGSCYNNLCLTDIEGDPLVDGAARPTECRGYPETASPFPVQVVESSNGWVLPDGTTESDPTSLDSQPYAFLYGFQSAEVCAPFDENVDGDPEASDECLCSYSKASYGTQAETRYYPTTVAVTEVLTGICVGGNNAGAECEQSNAASVCGDTGSCSILSRQDVILGWDGYCLEKDTSIQLYGSADEDDRACLTWLPVDQLTGSTDLYGKYLEAGYPPQDTFFCAEIQGALDLKVMDSSGGAACAEHAGVPGICKDSNGWSDFTDPGYLRGSCLESVWCPDGYFAVMTGCGNLSYTNGSAGDRECTGGDDDCPFYCVPKGAYKTEDDSDLPEDLGPNGLSGTPCLPPMQLEKDQILPSHFVIQSGAFNGGVMGPDELDTLLGTDRAYPGGGFEEPYRYALYADGNGDYGYPQFDVYLVHDHLNDGVNFYDLFEYYDDCETRGLVADTADSFIFPFESAAEIGAMEGSQSGTDTAFRGLSFPVDSYAACTAVVQVADDVADTSGNYNYAWTDRAWLSGSGYAVQDDDDRFRYMTSTEQAIFGMATDVNAFIGSIDDASQVEGSLDLYPMPVVMCADGTVGGVGGECDLTNSSGLEAQPYYDVLLGGEYGITNSAGTANEKYCANSDGNINTPGGETDPECQCEYPDEYSEDCNVGISCDDKDGDGFDDTCVDGLKDGESCDTDEQCWSFKCRASTSGKNWQGLCISYDALGSGIATSLEEVESEDDAINRLRQIFASAMRVWLFRDGFGGKSYDGATRTEDLYDSELGDWVFADAQEFTYFDQTSGHMSSDLEEDEELRFADWMYENFTIEGDPSNVDSPEFPSPPVVIAVGDCEGTHCTEDSENAFSVDGQSSGVISGGDGYEHVTVSFFVAADEDQMPIRNMIVNWGDGDVSEPEAWPLDSYSGSVASSNYYKNHRGYDQDDVSMCTGEDWALSSDACESTYVTFVHDYVCTSSDYNALEQSGRDCKKVTDGAGNQRLLASPCAAADNIGTPGSCVFQPRVYVKDNWGWCTGYCDGDEDGDKTTDDSTSLNCYGNECSPSACPSTEPNGVLNEGSTCPDHSPGVIVNPWINFNGYVEVAPR
jgi:hypothetical protein